MVNRNSPIPIYYQLKLYFKQQMEAGILRPGDRLPTEMDLCERYAISRAPVRRALTDLARDGYVTRHPGQGTFVAPSVALRSQERIRLNLMTYEDNRWLSLIEEATRRWNLLHPEQEIDLDVAMYSRDEFHGALSHAVARGEAPDIVSLDFVWLTDYASAGYLTPLDALDASWVQALREDMAAPIAQNNIVGGHLYGLPTQTDVTGLWYRRDWLEQLGKAPPETWADWLDLLDTFAAPETQARFGHRYSTAFPVGIATGEAILHYLISFIWLAGGDVVDAGGTPMLDVATTTQALDYLRSITVTRRAQLPEDTATFKWWDFSRLLGQGRTPMTLGGTYEIPVIQEEAEWEDEAEVAAHLGFAPVPRPSLDVPPVHSLGGTTWAIPRQSAMADIGLEILKLAVSPELSMSFCEKCLQISPYRSVNRKLDNAEHAWMQQIIPLLDHARPRPKLRNYPQISRFLQDMIEQVLWQAAPLVETVEQTAQVLALL